MSDARGQVIHAGIYYGHNTLKTKLCVEGKQQLYAYCDKHGIPYMNCGKWVVAQTDEQLDALHFTHDFAKSIDVPTRFISAEEAQRREPDVRCQAGALESPSTGIVDSHSFMQRLHGEFEEAGGTTALRSPVTKVQSPTPGSCARDWRIYTAPPDATDPIPSSPGPRTAEQNPVDPEDLAITAETVINSAGLYAIGLSNSILPPERHKKPFYAKGTYYSYSKSHPKPSTLIYPAPVPGHGGLGTHLTLDMSGRVRFGPDVEWVDSPVDLAPNPDRERFDASMKDIKSYMPGLDVDAVALDYCGIRPKLGKSGAANTGKGGAFIDFYVKKEEGFDGFVNLMGIESPGLTSSLAIGEHVFELLYR